MDSKVYSKNSGYNNWEKEYISNIKSCLLFYSKWTGSCWTSYNTNEEPNKDKYVLGFGIGGEIGEVVEAFQERKDDYSIKEEIGDAFYYIVESLNYLGFNVDRVFEKSIKCVKKHERNFESLSNYYLNLSYNALLIMEVFKKEERGSRFNNTKFEKYIIQVISLLLVICKKSNYSFDTIIKNNIKKVEKKYK